MYTFLNVVLYHIIKQMYVFINEMKIDLSSIVCLHVAKVGIHVNVSSALWGAVVTLVSFHVVKKPWIQNEDYFSYYIRYNYMIECPRCYVESHLLPYMQETAGFWWNTALRWI